MENQYPNIEILTPEGEEKNLPFAPFFQENPDKTQITIGRWDNNDICLPDLQSNISRHHCTIEFDHNTWLIRDQGSANGTFIQRAGLETEIDVRRHDAVALQEQDRILILAHITPEDSPIFWELIFHDPGVTKPKKGFEAPYELQ